jgi:hypothetical protein
MGDERIVGFGSGFSWGIVVNETETETRLVEKVVRGVGIAVVMTEIVIVELLQDAQIQIHDDDYE